MISTLMAKIMMKRKMFDELQKMKGRIIAKRLLGHFIIVRHICPRAQESNKILIGPPDTVPV